jgi:hypothetical protein
MLFNSLGLRRNLEKEKELTSNTLTLTIKHFDYEMVYASFLHTQFEENYPSLHCISGSPNAQDWNGNCMIKILDSSTFITSAATW